MIFTDRHMIEKLIALTAAAAFLSLMLWWASTWSWDQ